MLCKLLTTKRSIASPTPQPGWLGKLESRSMMMASPMLAHVRRRIASMWRTRSGSMLLFLCSFASSNVSCSRMPAFISHGSR